MSTGREKGAHLGGLAYKARYRATVRLVKLHQADFDRLYSEERVRLGLTPKPGPGRSLDLASLGERLERVEATAIRLRQKIAKANEEQQ